MRMFNADGSEGKMCGNAIRCVGKYLYESGVGATRRIFARRNGFPAIKYLQAVCGKRKVCIQVRVDMGRGRFCRRGRIPVLYSGEGDSVGMIVL